MQVIMCFTGNFWGQGREVIDQIIVDADERFLIFGKNWHKVPRVQRFWRGFLEYDALPDVYRSATITIDDTAGPHVAIRGYQFSGIRRSR